LQVAGPRLRHYFSRAFTKPAKLKQALMHHPLRVILSLLSVVCTVLPAWPSTQP
jgi:hypothetical protein